MNPRSETSTETAAKFQAERGRRRAVKQRRRRQAAERRLDSRWRRVQAISLTMLDGLCARDVAALTDLSVANVAQVLSRAGVHAAPYEPLHDAKAKATLAVAGGACIVDAAIDAGASYETIRKTASGRGIKSKVTGKGRIDGRSRRAAARVLFGGETVNSAAAAERCSTTATSKMIQVVREALR